MNSPQPSVKEMQQFLAAELSGRSRIWYTLLLLFDLIVASAVGSLLFTEPNLPTRTRIAFGCIVLIALAWALVIGRTLALKKVLLARHRVVTGRLAALVTAVFMLAALVLAATTPAHRDLGLAAGSLGAVMFAVALFIWRRAARRLDQLIQRTRKLERGLTSGSVAQLLLVLIGGSLVFLPGEAIAQQPSPAPIEMQVSGTRSIHREPFCGRWTDNNATCVLLRPRRIPEGAKGSALVTVSTPESGICRAPRCSGCRTA